MKVRIQLAAVLVLSIVSSYACAQHGGPQRDLDRRHDMETFQFLLRHRDEITRTVTRLPDGVETLTESENSEVVAKLQDHVAAMHQRLQTGRPIHMRDPLFREVFQHAKQIEMKIEETPRGLTVRETSQSPYVVKLIQAHAEVLNQFLAHGHEEVRKDHPAPSRNAP